MRGTAMPPNIKTLPPKEPDGGHGKANIKPIKTIKANIKSIRTTHKESTSRKSVSEYTKLKRKMESNRSNDAPPTAQCKYITKTHGLKGNDAIWDSGASHGIHWNRNLFTNIHKPHVTSVKGISGSKMPITEAGTCQGINGILLMPSCSQPVISCTQFLDQHGGKLLLSKRSIKWLRSGRATHIADRDQRGLYTSAMSISAANTMLNKTARANLSIQAQILREKAHNLHRCLGHIGIKKMRQVLRRNYFTDLKEKDLRLMINCDACNAGKIKRANKRREASRRPTEFGHTIRSDTSSRQEIATKGKKRYANITVDEATRWVWVSLLRKIKNTGKLAVGPIISNLHNEGKIKVFGSDMGSEFHNKHIDELLSSLGIQRQSACSDNQQQNGLAERTIGILFEKTRTLLADSKLPLSFWGEAIKLAAYLRNRLPIESNEYGASPYELRYGKQPDLKHLRPFGSECTVLKHSNKQGGSKAKERGYRGIFVGYGDDEGLKGYRVYLPEQSKIVTTPNVKFKTDMVGSIEQRHEDLGEAARRRVGANRHNAQQRVRTSRPPSQRRWQPANQPTNHKRRNGP
jgi:hypothetical protein